MKQLLTIALLLILITAGRKKATVLIEVKDYITGDGSAYANQTFTIIEKWTPFYDSKTKTIASGILDENGQAAVELKLNENRKYTVGIQSPENVCYSDLDQYSLTHDKTNKVKLEFLKCGFVNFQFNNMNCEGDTDKFRFRYSYLKNPEIYRYYGYAGGDHFEWNPDLYISGCHVYLGDFSESRPVGTYLLEWQVERSSGTSEGSDIITILENDTTTYLIEY